MGVNPTQSNFKSFTFDGTNSRAYGVYITGEGVFNAPERNVEMVDIPGRNGAFALDKGNFNNIEVTYPAGIFADTEADFAQAVSDMRNWLCSKVGYVRLEDDYNPNEYRIAIYKSGLDVDHDKMLIAGEFDLTFECKPQRYLKSGETAISVTSGNTITNPTRFEAKPLLEVEGYGTISFNGYKITTINGIIGQIVLEENTSPKQTIDISTAPVNNGDALTLANVRTTFVIYNNSAIAPFTGVYNITSNANNIEVTTDGNFITIVADYSSISTTFGDSSTLQSITISFEAAIIYSGTERRMKLSLSSGVDGLSDGGATVNYPTMSTQSVTGYTGYSFQPSQKNRTIQVGNVCAFSTLSYTTQTAYIDCDIGEAYMVYNGIPVTLNGYADIGSELPTLASGANTITYDNTFTQFDIVPRWWQV